MYSVFISVSFCFRVPKFDKFYNDRSGECLWNFNQSYLVNEAEIWGMVIHFKANLELCDVPLHWVFSYGGGQVN